MACESLCLFLCLTHAGLHLWNEHKREMTARTKNENFLFFCLCLCLFYVRSHSIFLMLMLMHVFCAWAYRTSGQCQLLWVAIKLRISAHMLLTQLGPVGDIRLSFQVLIGWFDLLCLSRIFKVQVEMIIRIRGFKNRQQPRRQWQLQDRTARVQDSF